MILIDCSTDLQFPHSLFRGFEDHSKDIKYN